MPRQNPTRSIGIEDELVTKIRVLRHKRGWSYEALAGRMGSLGCPISPSALHRMEQGTPRRPVSVDELVALSRVFEVDVDVLLSPPDLAVGDRAADVIRQAELAVNELADKRAQAKASLRELDLARKSLARFRSQLLGLQAEAERAAAGPWEEQMTDTVHGPLLQLTLRIASALRIVDGALADSSHDETADTP